MEEEDQTSTLMDVESQQSPFHADFKVDEQLKASLLQASQQSSVYNFMIEVYDVSNANMQLQSFQLKTVNMDAKLSFVILKMLTEKIHRIIV
jgi:hypothetical protein